LQLVQSVLLGQVCNNIICVTFKTMSCSLRNNVPLAQVSQDHSSRQFFL